MMRKELSDLSNEQINKIKNMLKIHDRWKMVYNSLENPENKTGIILVDTYNADDAEWTTMASPRFLDDIDQLPLYIREITTVEPDDEKELEVGSYPGALRINLTVGYPPRITPKSDLYTGTIPTGY